jgi:hypothetical protein
MRTFNTLYATSIQHMRLLLVVVLFSFIAVFNFSVAQAADPTCFSANSKVTCGKNYGSFDITLQTTNANGVVPTTVVIESLTPGVTLSPHKPLYLVVNGQVKVTVVGALPGQVLDFSVEGSTTGEGSVAGTDLCCNGKVQVTIPSNLNCPLPPFFISIQEFCELVVVDLGGSGYSSICHIKVKTAGLVNLPVSFAHFLKGTGTVKFLKATGPWSCSPTSVSDGDPMDCVLPANALAAPYDTAIIDVMVTFDDAAAVKSAQACPVGTFNEKQLRRYCTSFTLKDKAVIDVPKLVDPPKLNCDARTSKLVGGKCLCTVKGMVPVSKASCGCPDGTRLRDGACRKNPPPPPPPPKCGNNERLNSKGVCVQKPVICGPNERLVNGRCLDKPIVCGPDKRLVNGRCIDRPLECPPGTKLSRNGRACLPIIQPCPPGTKRLKSGKCVVIEQPCPRGTVRRDGECVFVEQKCPRGTVRRDGECVFIEQKCPRGFVRRDGECIEVQQECPPGTINRRGRCIDVEQPRRCRFPKILIGDQCVRIRLPKPPRDEPPQDGPVLNDNPRPNRGCVDDSGEPTPCVQ